MPFANDIHFVQAKPTNTLETRIQTKFTIATDDGIRIIKTLSSNLATEKFSALLDEAALTEYIQNNYSDQQLINGMNALGNQWLVVYKDGEPAGYCRITDKGTKPAELAGKRTARIADFGILKNFRGDDDVRKSLLDKCINISRNLDAIWIHEYADNPDLSFFESNQFGKINTEGPPFELPLPSVWLIRMNV